MLAKLVFVLIIMHAVALSQVKTNSELEQYIRNIRKSRMTEDAENTLKTISSIRTGHTNLTFVHDSLSGMYGAKYSSTLCPRPGADSLELEKIYKQVDQEISQDLKKIRSLADFDGSGFITTEEATRFSKLINMGLMADFVARKNEPDTVVAHSMGISKSHFQKLIQEYKEITSRAKALGIPGFPAWPFKD